MNKKIILLIVLVMVLISVGTFAYFNFLNQKQTGKEQGDQSASENMELEVSIAGVIRSTGLNADEKYNLGLDYGDFQLTDIGETEQKKLNTDAQGFYLEAKENLVKDFLGKCVVITAQTSIWNKVPEYGANNQFTYLRSAFVPKKIEITDYKNCNPYRAQDESLDATLEKRSLRGVLQYAVRPAPDIGYDYELRDLEIPFIEQSTGLGQKVYRMTIMPKDNAMWQEFEENIGKTVTIEGYLKWGYSESQYVDAISLIK